jgi:hypothetical protein
MAQICRDCLLTTRLLETLGDVLHRVDYSAARWTD